MSEIYETLNDNLQTLLIMQIEQHIANVKAGMYDQPKQKEITLQKLSQSESNSEIGK